MTYGWQICEARQGREPLCDLLDLSVTRRHVTPDRSAIPTARHRFFARVGDHAHLPERLTPIEAVELWWDGIETYLTTGITDAVLVGHNRLIKVVARNAFGFRNRANQRFRSCCATTRRNRREAPPSRIRRPHLLPRRLPHHGGLTSALTAPPGLLRPSFPVDSAV
ncbi:transposase [Streptomyces sp. NBC_01622]|uniref:transposase n=1 Tax=Streptomyces sp. NBC_01622 TaxID=2975903 RepID=UPI0038661915|nr:transposase [Streptomyces sp. NBC_01622]